MMAIIGLTAAPWARVALRIVSYRWVAVLLGIVLAMLALLLLFVAVENLTTQTLRRGFCPKCQARLERTGSGFYDFRIVPDPWELVVYVLSITLAFGAAAAIGSR